MTSAWHADCRHAAELFDSLESHRASLEMQVEHKSQVLARLSSGAQSGDAMEQETTVVLEEDEILALQAVEDGDFQRALDLYGASSSPRALYSFVCVAVRHFWHRLESQDDGDDEDDLSERVGQAFLALEKQHPDLSGECDAERAAFLGGIEGDSDAALIAYERAVRAKPEDAHLLYNYANFLCMDLEGDPELSALAEDMYRRALELEPDMVMALNNLSALLVEKSRAVASREDRARLEEARGLLERAEALAPGAPAYNLACADALLGDLAQCRTHLELALRTLPVSGADLGADPDLAACRKQPWFAALCARR
jgi:tetratricopeptide (TPR) repeat protein